MMKFSKNPSKVKSEIDATNESFAQVFTLMTTSFFSDESSSGDMSDEDEILDKLEQELSDLGDSDD